MKKKEISINTLNVQLRVLTLDNKRFTKSVFDQLHVMNPFDYKGEMIGEIIGFVKTKDEYFPYYLLFTFEGNLLRYGLHEPFLELADTKKTFHLTKSELKCLEYFQGTLQVEDQIFISI